MNIPSSEPIPPEEEGESLPYKHRRLRRSFSRDRDAGRSAIQSISHLLSPSFDYYLGFLLAGMICAAAMLLDAPGFYLLAVLFAPFLGPVFGIPFAAVLGSGWFFLQSLFHLLAGGGLIFAIGALTGWISVNLPAGAEFTLISTHNAFSWPNLIVAVVGAGLTTYLLVRSPRQKPLVANIAVVYGLMLPLAASGFALTNGTQVNWIGGLVVFLVHLALSIIIAAVLFLVLGLKPASLFGYALTTVFILAGIAAILIFRGMQFPAQIPAEPLPGALTDAPLSASATQPATVTPTRAEIVATPVQITSTITITAVPSNTPTISLTFEATPIWARINAPSGGGAFIRDEPGGKILTSLLNGIPVTVISEPLRVTGGEIWVKISTESGTVGWILQSLLATATPSPGW